MSALERLLPPAPGHTAIAPLFWQRGEGPSLITAELERMRAYGLDGVVVESRPHPGFLGPDWWRDLDAIIAGCRRLGMRAWIFDDQAYPTGFVAGAVPRHPAVRKRFVRHVAIEAPGPQRGGRLLVAPWLGEGERLLAAAGGRVAADGTLGELVDLGADVQALRWDVPAGRWRAILAIDTPRGGEEWTRDQLNPIDPAGVQLLLDTVYELHHRRYAADFGGTFAGFFSDEPRLGSTASYEAVIGRHPGVLPWSAALEEALRRRWGGGFACALVRLAHGGGAEAARNRHAYMDELTRAWRTAWSRIGAWCEQRGVEWTGHLVEDNGAHSRLGYGTGHFFRGTAGMHVGGMDAVYQIQPECRDGRLLTPFGELDASFFFWGITRLAASAAALDPGKRGVAMAECFGAYGWRHGLRDMLWLTNHLLARGINRLVPHAWSMRWPDADCPPHFHALGHNPQSRHFPRWAAYAGRLCRQLVGGSHPGEAAVLYHAEAEWSGACQPFEAALRVLALRQLDGEVLDAETLAGPRCTARAGRLAVAGGPDYACLVLPWAERQPLAVLARAAALAEAGVPVFVLRALPLAAVDGDGTAILTRLAACAVVLHEDALAQACIDRGLAAVTVEPPAERPDLRLWRYRRAGRDLLLAVNEDPRAPLAATLRLPPGMPAPAAYDAMHDARVPLTSSRRGDGGWDVALALEPAQALLLIAPGDDLAGLPLRAPLRAGAEFARLDDGWRVSTQVALQEPVAQPALTAPGDLTAALPGFAGSVRYERDVQLDGAAVLDLGEVEETASVRLDGVELGTRLAPPYRFALAPAQPGRHRLEVEVVTTLASAHGANRFDRAWVQRPAGLLGPVRLCEA